MLSLNLREFKEQFDHLIAKVKHDFCRYRVTRRNDTVLAVIPVADLALLERLEAQQYIQHAKQGLDVVKQQNTSMKIKDFDTNTPYQLMIASHLTATIETILSQNKTAFLECLDSLVINPHPIGSSKIPGMQGLCRINIGTYIMLYKIEEKKPTICLLALLTREEV